MYLIQNWLDACQFKITLTCLLIPLRVLNLILTQNSRCMLIQEHINMSTHSIKSIQSIPGLKSSILEHIHFHEAKKFNTFEKPIEECAYLMTILDIWIKWLEIIWLHVHLMWSKLNHIVRMNVNLTNTNLLTNWQVIISMKLNLNMNVTLIPNLAIQFQFLNLCWLIIH